MRVAATAIWLCVAAGITAWLLWSWPMIRKSIALRVITDYFARQPSSANPATLQAIANAWPSTVTLQTEDWNVLRRAKGKGGVTVVAGPLHRYRLAGTFASFEGDAGAGTASRRAVIDDLQKSGEYLLREGESVDGLTLVKIFNDHVTVNINGHEETLNLSFTDTVVAPAAPVAGVQTNEVVISTSRYGKRIANDRWVLSREALMQYYEELRKDPERVLQLFDSFQPSYTADKLIEGYKIHEEGEKEFFSATGLKEGDVVRKVNSINMTSQKRAEYLIGEFLQKRMSAVVFDIEREGKPQKLIYFVR